MSTLRPNCSYDTDVCVVIPTFNRSALLRRALASIERQDCGPLQIAVCNDASSDNTVEVLLEFSQSTRHRLKFITNSKNAGPAVSFSNAAALAETKYLLAMGDDDVIPSNYVSKIVAIAKSRAGVVAVFPRQRGLSAILTLLRTYLVLGGTAGFGPRGLALFMAGNQVTGPGTLFDASVMKSKPMHPSNIYAQDFELWLSLALVGKLVYSNLKIDYSRTPGSLSSFRGVAHDLDLGLTVRRALKSHFFLNYLDSLSGDQRRLLVGVFGGQLTLLRSQSPLAYEFACFGSEYWTPPEGPELPHVAGLRKIKSGVFDQQIFQLSHQERIEMIEAIQNDDSTAIARPTRAPSASRFVSRARVRVRALKLVFEPKKLEKLPPFDAVPR